MKALFKQFPTATHFTSLINAYFAGVGIEANAAPQNRSRSAARPGMVKAKSTTRRSSTKTAGLKHDPPTMAGLALHLGFNTLDELKRYANNGKYAVHLNRALLLVSAEYEKKLHNSNPSGAIFALKAAGWNNEKNDDKTGTQIPTTLPVVINESGPKTASNEKDVVV